MKIQFWSIGKSHESYVQQGIELFTKRLQHYYPASWKIIPPPKNAGKLSEDLLKKAESEIIAGLLTKDDYLIVLDEKGKRFTSEKLAAQIELAANSTRNLVFLIGGAYGTHDSILQKAKIVWSLSDLVFPHQLVRLILAEQVYRACTIIKNEKYHH